MFFPKIDSFGLLVFLTSYTCRNDEPFEVSYTDIPDYCE